MYALFNPVNRPVSRYIVKSVSLGSLRYTSTAKLVATGYGTADAYTPTTFALLRDVSNMIAGPLEPRDSKFSTTPPSAASGSWLTNASAPQRQASSASVNTNTVSLRGRGPVAIARAVSSSDDTPAPSSFPPYDTCTES